MTSRDISEELNSNDLLRGVPRAESITVNQGFIPESWFFWRRWTRQSERSSRN